MVELKHHQGIVELPQRHERKQGVMSNQAHGVSEPGVGGQCRHVVVRLSMKISGMESDVPRNQGPNKQRSPDPRGTR